MPKVFYTEKDIEDMVKGGSLTLEINDNVVLTDLAYEKANRLGMKLVREKPENPPGAPVRPYITQKLSQSLVSPVGGPSAAPVNKEAASPAGEMDLRQRIRQAVIAQLGNQVDSALLDVIIQRVLASTGVK